MKEITVEDTSQMGTTSDVARLPPPKIVYFRETSSSTQATFVKTKILKVSFVVEVVEKVIARK